MGGGAWPFLVGGVICLVNSVNERDLSLLTSRVYPLFTARAGRCCLVLVCVRRHFGVVLRCSGWRGGVSLLWVEHFGIGESFWFLAFRYSIQLLRGTLRV